jgi:hypothetical protein
MKVSGQLHVLAALRIGNDLPVATDQKGGKTIRKETNINIASSRQVVRLPHIAYPLILHHDITLLELETELCKI